MLVPVQWNEPFGLVMIEAMACGTPVVAHNLGSISEVVDQGITGFHANSIDAAQRHNSSQAHRTSPEEYALMRRAAIFLPAHGGRLFGYLRFRSKKHHDKKTARRRFRFQSFVDSFVIRSFRRFVFSYSRCALPALTCAIISEGGPRAHKCRPNNTAAHGNPGTTSTTTPPSL